MGTGDRAELVENTTHSLNGKPNLTRNFVRYMTQMGYFQTSREVSFL